LQNDTELGADLDFTEKLHNDFPLMYSEHCSVWVDKGWEPIVYKLSFCIQNYIDQWNSRRQWLLDNNIETTETVGPVVEQVIVAQVKEKFGGLRFYYDYGDDFIAGLVEMAEIWAENTCEVCGAKGHQRNLSWVRTLCDEHYEEHKAKQTFIPKVDSTPDDSAN
jgi:hypothetical protein